MAKLFFIKQSKTFFTQKPSPPGPSLLMIVTMKKGEAWPFRGRLCASVFAQMGWDKLAGTGVATAQKFVQSRV